MPSVKLTQVKRLALAFSCLVLAGELGLRLLDHARKVPSGSLYSAVDTTADPYRLVPGTDLVMPERYGDIRYTVNRDGYRDRDWEEPGRPLIVVVGDSVAFGLSVEGRERFPELLEEALRAGSWPRAEVRNLSVFGYGGYEELAALRQFGLPSRPDLVIAQFYQNDVHTPAPTFSLRHQATIGQRLQAVTNRLLTASNLYRRVSQLFGGIAYRLRHDARRRDPSQLNAAEPQQVVDLLTAEPNDEKILAFGFLDEMRSECERAGARFMVLSTPNEAQLFSDRWDEIDRRLARFATSKRIAFLDSLEPLRADPERGLLFRDGVHLSPAGHRRVAAILAAHVEALLATGAGP